MISAISGVLLFVNPDFLAYVPKALLAGLLITIGADSVKRWLIGRLSPARLERITVAGGDRRHHRRLGLRARAFRSADLRLLTIEVSAGRVNVVKFAFDGSNTGARSIAARGSWRFSPRKAMAAGGSAAKLPLLRFGQPAL